MFKIIRASLYKLFKDRPFKITLIIGVALAVVFSLAYHFILPEMGSGYNMLISSSSPSNNFGLAVPINLITFIIGEYNYGTIRNKIIAGNKRINIYIALFVMGLIYSLAMMTIYVGMSVGLSTILNKGFYLEGVTPVGAKTILTIIGATIMVYVTLTALSVLAASAIRNIGGAITVTVILIMIGYLVGMVVGLDTSLSFEETIKYPVAVQILDPIFLHSVMSMSTLVGGGDINELLPFSLLSNGIYTAAFLTGGIVLFQYRDVK